MKDKILLAILTVISVLFTVLITTIPQTYLFPPTERKKIYPHVCPTSRSMLDANWYSRSHGG